jgi:uncharacterized repeat protein (TIGR01451 family)
MSTSNAAIRSLFLALITLTVAALPAHAALTIQPITWNIVGLDSNSPATGPNRFPVGARVCSNVATTNVSVQYLWDSANAFVALRAGSLSTITLPSISAGGCADAYFEAEVQQTAAAFDTTRRYHVTATDVSGTVSTPTPREIYVEHLISQSRNSISDVKYGPNAFSLTSVAPGSGMSLAVGNTYTIQLLGGTATQGYNQFEAFINFPNTIFQVLDVDTTYSANNSPYVSGPAPAIHDRLYADACGWENDPNSPNSRSCVGGDYKSGGSTVITTYTIKIIGGGGTSQALNTLLYDFSGSSFHYNADFATGARVANIIDPTTATIAKSFSPNPTGVNGLSVLTITLGNPNPGTLGGYNFVDNLPGGLVIATPPGATTSGCGTPTLTANAGAGTITFANGTLAANSTCVIGVNVTSASTGTYNNTTNNLFIDTLDTGKTASASLTVTTDTPGTGICGTLLARWNFPTGMSTTAPAATTANVTATASASTPQLNPVFNAADNTIAPAGTGSWSTNGAVTAGLPLSTANNDYFQFAIDTTGYTSMQMTFDAQRTNNGAKGVAVYYGTSATPPGAQAFATDVALTAASTWFPFSHTFNSGLNPAGVTYFRVYVYNSNNDNPGADVHLDNVIFTGCTTAIAPTIAKSFAPDPIAVNGVSTLTFTLTNTNAVALTGAKFIDTLPAGLQVAATPAASTTCGGSPSWAPAAVATTLSFGQTTGATIPASGSCTVSVNVTATTGGPHANVSGFLFTTESGTSSGSVGSDTLTAVLPPVIAKQFAPSPILAGGSSRLTFTITNPNQNDALSGVAFSDTFPLAPGAMKVAPVPNPSTSGCGAPTFSPAAGAGSISFTGGTIAAGGTCTVAVDITAPAVGTYTNTSGNVSHIINATPVNGNTASDTLEVEPPSPSIALLKQVSTSASGPWTTFLPLSAGPVYYRFTLENTGDVPLTNLTVIDDTLNVSGCNATFTGVTLPVAVAANDNHIVSCIVGPVAISSGSHTNTASATGIYSGTPYPSESSAAMYATTALTLDKTSPDTTFIVAGDQLDYNYLVTNTGFAPLVGPVTVADDKATVTCPAVTTVGDLDNFLDPGESITCTAIYLITAADVTAGFVTNTASATVQSVSSNTDNVTILSSTSVDVSLVKSLTTGGPYSVGQSITYTLLIANAGPSTATGIDVTDTPSNLTITNVSGACVALPCVIASLAPGANTSITVTATINAAGAFDNSATATPDQTDPTPANNTDNTGNNGTAAASADVSLVKTLTTGGPYVVGQSITYTLLIANAGPSTATGIDVTDTPSNLTITNVSGACVALPCVIASLASGANTSINVTATINATGAFDNSATATPDENDPTPANNTDNTGNNGTAVASADVSLVKTLITGGSYFVGQSVTYTLLIANAGPSTATGIDVTDTPTNLTITNVSGACVALPCVIASLASGANTSITVTATINAVGAFDNSATATPDENDPTPANNTDNTGNNGTAAASADVALVKTLTTGGPFTIGQSITYTLLIANAGPSTATGIDVTDTPTNLTITNVSGACVALPCVIASLASGANTTITVTATINAAGAFDNSATATPDENDPTPANNTDNTGNNGTAAASADVSLVKTLTTGGPFTIGQSITYTLLIANAGPSTATGIDVTDTPTNLTITNVSGACVALPCVIASLASGANTSITVTATINAAGAFDNSATATPDENDPTPANNTDNTGNNGTAAASADVSLVKTLTTGGPYTIGQSITYTLLVANAGPSTATGIDVTDTPTNLTITNVTGACVALPCVIASLASGANTSITVTATVNAVGAFDNSATATPDESDPTPANNTDNTGNNGTAAASADVSLVKTLTTGGPFTIGQPITYTLLIANAGPSTATGIDVTDTPTNLTITNVSGACVALPCVIASLASGANTSITVTATINAAGAFDNSATATPDENDPTPANNTDNTGNNGTAAASADVSLVKTLTTGGLFTIGQPITYTLLIANAGPSTATGIDVTDTPTNLTITNVTGACVALPCVIASLASGANTSITVTATINTAGAFDNSATATPDENDPTPANNTDNTGNNGTAAASADVSLVKTLTTGGPFTIGQSITYTLLIANAGPSTATGIDVTDTPTNLTITNVSGACVALPCVIASLASGANTSITVTATINAAGAFDNSATATPDENDPTPANNTDNTGNNGTAAASADVSLVKTLATGGPFTIGQSITYTLLIANAGPSTATGIDVTDTPINLTITNVTGACVALPCVIASLASGANTSITVTATINATGAFDNSATATPEENDPTPANNTDNTGNNGTAVASADISLVKTLISGGPYFVGQSVAYTLLIANAGPSTATGIDVTDTPSNLTITNVSGACVALPCVIASLASGANTSITVTATINAAGAFDNSATATPDENDPTPADNTDNTGNNGTAAASADVSIVKTLTTAGPFSIGQSISYTLLIANAGPSTATSIDVTDTPTNLTITNVSGACVALPCVIASLASGANTSITVTATIITVGAFDNVATATAEEPDPDPSDNTDDDGNNGVTGASADISIVKTLTTAGPFSVGQSISYTLLIANAGPSTATGINVTDTPTNLAITNVSGACAALPCVIASLASGANTSITVTATINTVGAFDNVAASTAEEPDPDPTDNTDDDGNNGITGASADVSIVKTLTTAGPFSVGQSISYTLLIANAGPSTATNIDVTDTPTNLTITNVSGACVALPCIIASLASGANTSITVTATINAAGAFDNVATANADEPDPDPTDNTDDDDNNGITGPSADVSIVKTLTSAGPFSVGQSVNYTLVVANAGPSTATNIDVTDTPTNLTITSVTGACVALPCTIPNLTSGANATIFVTATINASGTFDNVAAANADEPDPDPTDNTDDEDNGGGAPVVDLAIVKTSSEPTVVIGETFSFTLVVTNNGPDTATGVVVDDPLPANFTQTSFSTTQGSCSGTTEIICNLGTMLNGASVTITIHGHATATGTLQNTATVDSNESEAVTSNNTSSAAPVASASVAGVPTVSEWGLMLLAMMLAVAGVLITRSR